jgi:4-hydroxybenzoate polyprenyltransferase
MRDYTVDKAAGAITIAVQFGPRITALLVSMAALIGIAIWYKERGLDIAGMLVFVSILVPALLTIKKPNEQLIRYAMRTIALVVGIVGLYKIFY